MNKKVILVILLFIGISFIIYSFANPLTSEEENQLQNGGNIGDNINKNDDNANDDILNKDDIVGNDPADKDLDQNVDDEKDKNNSSNNNENGNNSSGITKPSTGSQNKPSTGSQNKPSTGSQNKPSTGGQNKPSTGNGNSQGNNGSTTKPTKPAENAKVELVKPTVDSINDVKNNIKITQNGTKIYVTGTMVEQPFLDSLQSTQYITLNYVASKTYTDEQLNNASFYVGNIKLDNKNAISKKEDGKPYISVRRGFMEGDVFKVKINWGDGGDTYEYEVHYDVKVIAKSDIITDNTDQSTDANNR